MVQKRSLNIGLLYESKNITHPWHVVEESPWPIGSSISAYVTVVGLVMWMNGVKGSKKVAILGIVLLLWSAVLWWKDVVVEGTYQGKHTEGVKEGIRLGTILFFVSECCLFAGFFWAYLHGSLSPAIELGSIWPPVGIKEIEYKNIPLENVIVLLSSGAVLTWAHEKLISGNESEARYGIILTIILGIIFLSLQYAEYTLAPFTISDSVYGSSFYLITTCHCLHVIIGSSFLAVGAIRLTHNTKEHHLGLEAAIIYWHIVDLIYLGVFTIVYWWGTLSI